MPTAFPPDLLALAGATEEVEIETRPAPDGPVHRTIVWAVVVDGAILLRSVRGPRGRWYRELSSSGQGILHVGGRRVAVRAAHATDAATIDATSHALERKYGPAGRVDTDAMLREETLPTTLRLAPA